MDLLPQRDDHKDGYMCLGIFLAIQRALLSKLNPSENTHEQANWILLKVAAGNLNGQRQSHA